MLLPVWQDGYMVVCHGQVRTTTLEDHRWIGRYALARGWTLGIVRLPAGSEYGTIC